MFGTLLSPAIRWIAGIVFVLAVIFGIYYKGRLDERAVCNAYKAEVKAAADAQATDSAKKDSKTEKLIKETKDAYNTQLANLRAYYGLRLAASGGTMPKVSGTAGGTDDYSPDNLPPTPVLAAQCAEETLKLYRLQEYERSKEKIME